MASKADPSKDSFVGEALAERILAKLRSRGEALQKQPSAEAFSDLLSPTFRATPLAGREVIRQQAGLEVSDAVLPAAATLDREQFFRELERFLSMFHRIESAEFHITGISIQESGDESAVQSEVHYELLGFADADEQRRKQVVGEWSLDWMLSDADWRIREWRALKQSRAESQRPLFTDVTESAIAHNDSYWEQIRPGADYWRSSLDGAVGVDVYGHHGVSLGDVDGDGDSDLYVSQPSGLPNRLYRNDGGLRFTDITESSGTGALDSTSMSIVADFDNDGDQDLLLIGARGPLLLRNDGTGRFRFNAGAFSFTAPQRSLLTSAAAADYDRDGDLDIYVCSYRYHAGAAAEGAPSPYHDANNGPRNRLFRNRGNGTFEDLTRASGLDRNNARFSFAASWGDYDADGWPDLYVANDFGRNNLYRNNRDGTFADVAREAGVEDIGAGMSAAWLDYDLDGKLDLYVGNMWSSAGLRVTGEPAFLEGSGKQFLTEYRRHAKGNSLFRGIGGGRFEEASLRSGSEMGRWAWSSDAVDLNNDGHQEIYVANGYVTNSSTRDL